MTRIQRAFLGGALFFFNGANIDRIAEKEDWWRVEFLLAVLCVILFVIVDGKQR